MKTGEKVLLGCGIGCLLVILAGVLLAVGSYRMVKGMAREFEEVEAGFQELERRHGTVDAFRPWPDGAVPAPRVEAFLTVRERTGTLRAELEATLEKLSRAEQGRITFLEGFRVLGSLAGLVPRVGDFYDARTQAMLEAEMGSGEYLYLYTLVFYSWLGRSPEDGPPFVLLGGDHGEEDDHQSEEEVRANRRRAVLREIQQYVLPMMRRQLAAQEDPGSPWAAALRDEIHAMERDAGRVPWAEGLPDRVAHSLEPFREPLAASYSPLTSSLELGPGVD